MTKLTVHENYAKPKQFENDIALWELAAPLEMNEFVSAAVLPEQEQQVLPLSQVCPLLNPPSLERG